MSDQDLEFFRSFFLTSADPALIRSRGVRDHLSRLFVLGGLGILAFSVVMARAGVEPFATWLYVFAWWSAIFVIDGCVFRKKSESLILTHTGHFFFLAVWSVVLWFIFEAINVRLGNWAYVDIPAERAPRWIGYHLAFATVVPAILEVADLVEATLIKQEVPRVWSAVPAWKDAALVGAGAGMLILSLAWPIYFFPLVWGAFVFLLDPLNRRLGAPSLFSWWTEGHRRPWLILLGAGLICGLIWESWNSLARARWVYSIPWVGDKKIFEMPLLGYLGFPFFALEVFVMTTFSVAVWRRTSRPVKWLLIFGAAGFSLYMCRTIDIFTVRFFQS